MSLQPRATKALRCDLQNPVGPFGRRLKCEKAKRMPMVEACLELPEGSKDRTGDRASVVICSVRQLIGILLIPGKLE